MKGEPINILLAEDNIDHAHLVIQSFKNYQVANKIHHVEDGREALDFLFRLGKYSDPKTSPRPHVFLLDLRMPKVDGLEVLQEVKTNEDLKTIPIVVLTSSSAEMDIVKAYKYSANSYIVKPMDFKGFTNLMEVLGFYWLGWNHYPWSEK